MQKLKPGISSIPRQAPSPRRSLAAAQISQSYQRPAVMKRGVFSPPFPSPWLFISHNVINSEVEGCRCSLACATDMHQNPAKNNQKRTWSDSASHVHGRGSVVHSELQKKVTSVAFCVWDWIIWIATLSKVRGKQLFVTGVSFSEMKALC